MTIIVLTALALLFQQQPASKPKQDCPMHDQMNARGEHAMGFSQTATTHHSTDSCLPEKPRSL